MEKDATIQHIVSHLNKAGLLNEDEVLTEDVFLEKIYINNDERQEILKALISSFSEEYRADLQTASSIDNVLAKKLYELEFVEEGKRFNFVRGKCTKEEQQVVYKKLFKALHLVLIGQEYSQNYFSSSLLTENLSKPDTELSACKLKKQSKKKFNLELAMQNLETANKTLEDASQFIDKHSHIFMTSPKKLPAKQIEESKFWEISNSVESFKNVMERHNISLLSECPEPAVKESSLATDLGAAVRQLRPILEFVAECTKSSSADRTEKKKDLEKMSEQAREMEKNAAVLEKCFSNNNIFSDEELHAHV